MKNIIFFLLFVSHSVYSQNPLYDTTWKLEVENVTITDEGIDIGAEYGLENELLHFEFTAHFESSNLIIDFPNGDDNDYFEVFLLQIGLTPEFTYSLNREHEGYELNIETSKNVNLKDLENSNIIKLYIVFNSELANEATLYIYREDRPTKEMAMTKIE